MSEDSKFFLGVLAVVVFFILGCTFGSGWAAKADADSCKLQGTFVHGSTVYDCKERKP
jgi:hypothetical protein